MLVADIAPGMASSNPSNFAAVGKVIFFSADDGTHGPELWKSDGTSVGTALVKDINPGTTGSSPGDLTNVGGELFFTADDGTHGPELWKSDGTAAGTTLVKDLNPGSTGSHILALTDVAGTAFFVANDGSHGLELWKSDGTSPGTALVKDINAGPGNAFPDPATGFLPSLANVNGTLLFAAGDGMHFSQLWRSDGSLAGTTLVADLTPSSGTRDLSDLTNVNGELFFAAKTFDVPGSIFAGGELWKSDATAANTALVQTFYANGGGFLGDRLESFTSVGGILFFLEVPDHLHQNPSQFLWRSDGTASGTFLLAPPSGLARCFGLTNVSGTLYFFEDPGFADASLWRSDGTPSGTQQIAPTSFATVGATGAAGGRFFFAASLTSGDETGLWASDGTAGGTGLVSAAASTPQELTNAGGTLFFSAVDAVHGRELWKSDGQPGPADQARSQTLATVLTDSASVEFVVTPGGSLYRLIDGSAAGWTRLGDNIQSVSAVAERSGVVAAYAVTRDRGLFRYDDVSGWQGLGAPGTIHAASAGLDQDGRADVYVLTTGTDFTAFRSSLGWQGLIGGRGSILSMSATGGGSAVVVTADHSVFDFDPRLGWLRLTGAAFAQSVSAVTDGLGRLVVFAQTLDKALYRYMLGGTWSLIGSPGSILQISAGIDASGLANVFAVTDRGYLVENDSAAGWSLLSTTGAAELSAESADRVFAAMPDGSLLRHDDTFGFVPYSGPGFVQI